MPRWTFSVAAVAVAALLIAWGVVGFRAGADPTEQVEAVSLDRITLAPSTATSDPRASARPSSSADPAEDSADDGHRQVEALDPLEGRLDGEDDPGEYRLGSLDLDFGPDAWVLTAPPMQDYDGDGRVERLEVELDALVGQQVELLVRLDDGNDAAVYVLNDRPYRDPAGPGPWAVNRPTTSPVPVDQIRRAAAGAVGTGARVDSLEALEAGQVSWEASVTHPDGREFEVLLDAAGEVLTVRED